MKVKTLVAVVLFSTSSFASANGGLGLGNTEQHMNADNWVNTQATSSAIAVQAPVDKFKVNTRVIMTNKEVLKHSYDGNVIDKEIRNDLIAGKPNFIAKKRRIA